MEKQVILLNGPSSSGKSTLAHELQSLILEERGERYEIVSIDDYLNMSFQEAIFEEDVFEISETLCEAVSKAVRTNDGVIVDHVITSMRIFDMLLEALRIYRIRLFCVTCPLEVLRQREMSRGDRCPGSAEASALFLFPKDGYEFTVDTYALTAANCAERIFKQCFHE